MTDPMPESMLEICDECMGAGYDPMEQKEITCEGCDGEGFLDEVTCDVCGGLEDMCGYCQGTGKLEDVPCPDCDSYGIVTVPVRCVYCNGHGDIPAREFELV